MSNFKLSGQGAFIGNLVGVHAILGFTFIAQPGKWLFTDWSAGRAIMAYGYLMMLTVGACVLIGAAVPPAIRLFRAKVSA